VIRTHVEFADFGREVRVFVIDGDDQSRRQNRLGEQADILRISPEGASRWEALREEGAVSVEPTLTLDTVTAQALCNGLATFFAGSSDVAFVKKVLELADGRVDTLIGGLISAVKPPR
jgi:hypothetical protein